VGLARVEFLARSLGIHPRKLLADGKEENFLDIVSQHVVRLARGFAPRAVVYRLLDLTPQEYASLAGGAEYENAQNPAYGLRGCSRALAEEDCFRLELRAVKRARDMGCVNVDLLLPFARGADELARSREIVIEEGLFASAEFELWMTAETSSCALGIEEFLPHVAGVAIGCDDLKKHLAGIDEVLSCIARIAQACRERGVASSLYGAALAGNPETIHKLVECGLTGLSVSPDALAETIAAFAAAEAELGILPEREIAM
jgi:pyruvate,water dikinase